jgi:hypothetical protein
MNDDQTKVMGLRLPNELAAEVKALARAEEVSISEAIRAAIYRHIAARRADKRFQEKLKERLEDDLRTLEQLSDSG